jgi:hypothetical protein
MNSIELTDKTKQVDAILYNLMGEYLEDGMDAETKSQFERWWDLKCIDVFNSTPLKTKKKIYEEG